MNSINNKTDNIFVDNLLQYIVDPSELKKKVATLQEKLPPILDDFKKYYIFINKNPTFNEYQTIYANLTNNINSISSELLTISKNVMKYLQTLNNGLFKLNNLIKIEKNKNTEYKTMESNVNNKYNGSKIMIDEYKKIYNESYIKNILMFVGIIISIIILVKVFGSNNTIINNVSNNLPPPIVTR